jgi:hypothetical protein
MFDPYAELATRSVARLKRLNRAMLSPSLKISDTINEMNEDLLNELEAFDERIADEFAELSQPDLDERTQEEIPHGTTGSSVDDVEPDTQRPQGGSG